MKDDATIARIREVRHKISEAHGHDPKRVIDYYIQLQEKYKERLVQAPAFHSTLPRNKTE